MGAIFFTTIGLCILFFMISISARIFGCYVYESDIVEKIQEIFYILFIITIMVAMFEFALFILWCGFCEFVC